MIGYLAKLGPISFTFRSFEFDDYERSTSWDWQSVALINEPPRLHFGGRNQDSVSLQGVLYFNESNSKDFIKLEELRKLGEKGEPVPFVYSSERVGQYLGKWLIKSVKDKRSAFNMDGSPAKLEFSIEIEKYPED
ncbi:MAG: phage tail protein [Oligoflexales bacterium]